MTIKTSFAVLSLFVGLSVVACSDDTSETPPTSSEQSADAGATNDDKDGSPSTPSSNTEDAGPGENSDSGADGSTQPTTTGPLTAKAAAAAMGHGFNLGQMFESTQQPRTFEAAKAKIDAYYAKGFRSVRIPITWTENVGGDRLVNDPNKGDVNRTHPRLAVITKVVDYALSLPNFYVVINAHHESGIKNFARDAVLERLWDDISDIFAARDHRLLYEFLNEPHRSNAGDAAMTATDLRRMTGKAYAKVRAREPERIVIIGGNQWFLAHELPDVWKNLDEVGGGNDAYLMATYHHYNPWSFCGTDPGNARQLWTMADVNGWMDLTANWAKTVGKGLPVYIGEWGVGWQKRSSTMDCNNVRKWYKEFENDGAIPHGQPTTVWDDGGWFKIFDHGSNTFANNLADCIMGSCTWTGTERVNGACK